MEIASIIPAGPGAGIHRFFETVGFETEKCLCKLWWTVSIARLMPYLFTAKFPACWYCPPPTPF